MFQIDINKIFSKESLLVALLVAILIFCFLNWRQSHNHLPSKIDGLQKEMDRKFDEINHKMDRRFDEVNRRFDEINRRFDKIYELLLEKKKIKI